MKLFRNYLTNSKLVFKTLAGIAFYYAGGVSAVRALNNIFGKRLTIVTYHRVTAGRVDDIEYSLPYLFVNVNTFERHIIFYKKYYNVINFEDLFDFQKIKELPWNSLIITFDDGYKDILINAVPILRKHGVSCTIFLPTDWVGRSEVPWWDEYFRGSIH